MKINETIQMKGSTRKEILVLGENHFKFDEVSRIRNLVISFNPDAIVHELWWEEETFFRSNLPEVPVIPLEKEVISRPTLKQMFKEREKSMCANIKKAIRKYDRVVIIVGDTHLRSIETDELGQASPLVPLLRSYGAKIIRSSYQEID